MEGLGMLLARFLLLCLFLRVRGEGNSKAELGRSDFPPGFAFGLGSAAYQYEGAAAEDGRGPSIWDTFSHTPGKTAGGATGDVANDQYHRYKEDVQLMVNMGIDFYRFSISWSRIFPHGRGAINKKGVAYYNNLINELLKHGIQPFVTLFHWDLPQALQDEYGGFLSHKVVEDFRTYAGTCFELFGDRIKYWTTLNEPLNVALYGYDLGTHAPGRCSPAFGNCSAGNSAIEPYIVTHHMLLSHSAAVRLYRNEFQAKQNGSIGIALDTFWFVPYDNSTANIRAARRVLDFYYGWFAQKPIYVYLSKTLTVNFLVSCVIKEFNGKIYVYRFMDPLTWGRYPDSMRRLVGTRLPRFSRLQSRRLRGSYDFLGINYYTAMYAIDAFHTPKPASTDLNVDSRVNLTSYRNGVPIGPPSASKWLKVYPRGLLSLLDHTKRHYNNPPIFVTENGVDGLNNATKPLNDTWRIQYHTQHLSNVLTTIRDGSNVRGYFPWTFLDDFEWDSGYSVRFGFYLVDRNNNLTRYPKESAYWFKKFLYS